MARTSLETKQLRLAVALADHGSLTRAGQVLSLSQPALSQQLSALEGRLGVALFHRIGKRMIPTATGAVLIDGARSLLGELQALERKVASIVSGKSARIRLGTQCYTVFHWLPRALARYRRESPHVDVQIVTTATHAPDAALLSGQLDIALLYQELIDQRMEAVPVFDDELVLIVPAHHRLARRPYVVPDDLVGEHVFTHAVPSDRETALSTFMGPASTPARVTQVYWAGAIVEFVRAGMGVGLAAPWSLGSAADSGQLVVFRLGHAGMRRRWMAATIRSRDRDTNVDALLKVLLEEAPHHPRAVPRVGKKPENPRVASNRLPNRKAAQGHEG